MCHTQLLWGKKLCSLRVLGHVALAPHVQAECVQNVWQAGFCPVYMGLKAVGAHRVNVSCIGHQGASERYLPVVLYQNTFSDLSLQPPFTEILTPSEKF